MIRRALLLAPAALFSAACAFRPWTPAVSVAYWSESVPPSRMVAVPPTADLYARWQLPPGLHWSRYQKMTLLASLEGVTGMRELPDIDALDVVHEAELAAARLGAVGLPDGTLLLVDLRGAASVAFGAALSQRAKESIALVPTFHHWPAPNELIPAEETLAAMLARVPRLPSATDLHARPVFLLDAWRLAFRFDAPDDGVYDNRYVLGAADLPAPHVLANHQIRRVIYVVESLDETEQEEEDLHPILRAYVENGVSVSMVDLAWLTALPDGDFSAKLGERVLTIAPRRTVLDEPSFYARARGGFGGVHAGPSPFRFGSIVHGGG